MKDYRFRSLEVNGRSLIDGEVKISGYKHAANIILAATVAAGKKARIENVPDLRDIHVLIEIVNHLGGQASIDHGILSLETKSINKFEIPMELSREMRGSIYLIPALIARFGKVRFEGSGGCQIGPKQNNGKRPVYHVYRLLEKFGVHLNYLGEGIQGHLPTRPRGLTVDMMEFSDCKEKPEGPVMAGATKVSILLALSNPEPTKIRTPFRMEVDSLLEYISLLGYDVFNYGDEIVVSGEASEDEVRYTLISDPSEIVTYITCSVMSNKNLVLTNLTAAPVKELLKEEFEILKEMGVRLEWIGDQLKVIPSGKIKNIDLEIGPYGFRSDHQPFFALMFLQGSHPCRIVEHVWKDRFQYAMELNKMGAQFERRGNVLFVTPGLLKVSEQPLIGHDVRSAATLLLAATTTVGTTQIHDAHHLDRGYVGLVESLISLGASIEIVR